MQGILGRGLGLRMGAVVSEEKREQPEEERRIREGGEAHLHPEAKGVSLTEGQ